ncbi:MAG: PKD domain-containing protein [Vicinamibacterales bacterium]
MQSNFIHGVIMLRLAAVTFVAAGVIGCSVGSQDAPPLAGPSEFGLSLRAEATPDSLPRDGSSQAIVRVTAFDAQGNPLTKQQRIGVRILALNAATLSATDVTTGPDGTALFLVTAPPKTVPGDRIVVGLTPALGDFGNVVPRLIEIGVTPSNPSAPVASFTFTPSTPIVGDSVAFNASASTDEGASCVTSCSFSWSFGDGSSGAGVVATHAYATAGNMPVTLTVADFIGATNTTTKTVTVTAPAPPVAVLTVSPSSNQPANTVLNFDGSGSTVGAPATIVEYTFIWGDGTSNTVGSNAQAQHAFATSGVRVVRLIVRDSLGRTATTTLTVTTP